MTGFDTQWHRHEGSFDEQGIVMTVHFRPDKLPEDQAEWYEWLSNYAKTTGELTKLGVLGNKKTIDFKC